jgi:hypothetical protein
VPFGVNLTNGYCGGGGGDGTLANLHIAVGGSGGIGVDIVAEFAKSMTAAGLPYSFYYSLKDSFYLNAISDNVKPSGLLPGQINVTQDQFEDISVAAVEELWSRCVLKLSCVCVCVCVCVHIRLP